MIKYDHITNKNKEKHNPKMSNIQTKILVHPYRVLLIMGSGSRKTNTLLNLKKTIR